MAVHINVSSFFINSGISWHWPWRVSNPHNGGMYVPLPGALTIRPPDRDILLNELDSKFKIACLLFWFRTYCKYELFIVVSCGNNQSANGTRIYMYMYTISSLQL